MKYRIVHIAGLASQSLLHYRWILAVSLGGILVIADLVELTWESLPNHLIQFLINLAIDGILIPFIFLLLMEWLARTENNSQLNKSFLEVEKELQIQLAKATNWDALVEMIVHFPRMVIPYIGAYLWVYDQKTNRFLLEAGWGFTGSNPPDPPSNLLQTRKPVINQSLSYLTGQIEMGHRSRDILGEGGLDLVIHYLPFNYQQLTLAVLYCYSPASHKVIPTEYRLLETIAMPIAMAIHGMRAGETDFPQSQAVREERSRIASDLHDTLAQDLAYLYHKLDYFSDTKNRDQIRLLTAQEELVRMKGTAERAYEDIRDILVSLEPEGPRDLVKSLQEYCDLFANRTGIETHFRQTGETVAMPAEVETHIKTILREALANIEFHAHASDVNVDLIWEIDHADLIVSDNGSGFDLREPRANGHFGLINMSKRAEDIKGDLRVTSEPGLGSTIHLTYPIKPHSGSLRSATFRWIT